MKTTFISLLAILFFQFVHSQTMHFDYDEAGHCILKYKTVTMQNIKPNTPDTTFVSPDSLDDIIGGIQVQILPNPTKSLLQVEIQTALPDLIISYVLMDMQGILLQGENSTNHVIPVDMSRFPTGTYLLMLTVNGKTGTYKIIRK
jgi:hypothetical protein